MPVREGGSFPAGLRGVLRRWHLVLEDRQNLKWRNEKRRHQTQSQECWRKVIGQVAESKRLQKSGKRRNQRGYLEDNAEDSQ